jgi:hypothetical protein
MLRYCAHQREASLLADISCQFPFQRAQRGIAAGISDSSTQHNLAYYAVITSAQKNGAEDYD